MLTYADVCWHTQEETYTTRLPTLTPEQQARAERLAREIEDEQARLYALCSRMLTYAHVC